MGYFYADQEAFEAIQQATGTDGSRHPLTFLLEAADDIAYKTADIEDAMKKGLLSYQQLVTELNDHCKDGPEQCSRMVGWLEQRYQKAMGMGYEKPETYAIQNWVVSVQGQMINCATAAFTDHYQEIMAGTYPHDLFYGTFGAPMMKALGQIAFKYAFCAKSIFKLEIGAAVIFDFLLEKFIDAVLNFDTEEGPAVVQHKLVSLISADYMRIYRICSEGKSVEEKLYLRLLLVTDYISGMTDSYAKRLYQELNGIA